MERVPPQSEGGTEKRAEAEVSAIIDAAVQEVVDAFSGAMAPRDRDLLEGVVTEKHTAPFGKVAHLHQLPRATGASAEMPGYVANILQTIAQQLTPAERTHFTQMGTDLLETVPPGSEG